ncbi:hypothetical protein R1flu_002187 [Riccia fluitans]|uniref:C2H2-type domain-containing protein n=1 Tax=Riccia fluitans TaxID=41844 RepID=A0ABD1Y8B8_9MARC
MQPVEDIWTCKRCGWTYPNYHPSAKHRRNHKKVCGKLPGFTLDDHHLGDGGSSDEASSGDESNSHHNKLKSAAPSVTPSPAVETQSRSFDIADAVQKSEIAAPAAAAVTESAAAPLAEAAAESTNKEASNGVSASEAVKPELSPVVGSTVHVPHPEEDIWICKACGWTYPNAHPSAKHRRNHKKHCPGKAGGSMHSHAGSSDDDSDSEHHVPRAAEEASAVAPAATVAEPQAQKTEPESTPVQTTNREFNLESVTPEKPAPVAAEEVPKAVESTPLVPLTAAIAAPAAVAEAPSTPAPTAAPVVVKGSAVAHPDDDIWICKECGWTYPNHHPSAKHRRNHKKTCPGKNAAAAATAPAPGGSSDDDSGDEHHSHHGEPAVQQPAPASPEAAQEAPSTGAVSREFNLDSVAQPAATPEAEKKLEEAARPSEIPTEKSAEATSSEETEEAVNETPLVQSSVPPPAEPKVVSNGAPVVPEALNSAVPHPGDDLWKCRNCDWTYPNAHPSAKHRRNHKKHCPGLAAHKGGSSDDDSDHESSHSGHSMKAHAQLQAAAPAEAVASVYREFQLPTQEVKEAAPPVLKVEEPKTEASPAPEVEEPKTEAPPVPKMEEEPRAAVPTQVEETEETATLTTPAPKVGSAAPHPEDPNDIWICKACGWTYPNAHPSAKHRRNHKKHCPGKNGGSGHGPGGSSDDASGDESSHNSHSSRKGLTSAPAIGTAVSADFPAVKERAMPDLGIQQPTTPVEAPIVIDRTMPDAGIQQQTTMAQAGAPKVETTVRTTVAQLVSDERSREQEAKVKEEAKSSAVPATSADAPHDPNDTWVCKECGWTYPNRHPSAKHRRNHKKVCKKTRISKGGSSSDASSDDEIVIQGKKKCFPCLS